jgi:hypothetical protein
MDSRSNTLYIRVPIIRGRLNGRTGGSDPPNQGSNPCPGTKFHMFKWLKKLFSREKKVVVVHPDPMYREAVLKAFTSGNPVIGNMNEDGTWDIKEIKPKR